MKNLGDSCKKAIELIQGERRIQYGDQWKNFSSIAALASLKTSRILSPFDIIDVMTSVKDMREASGHKADNRIDNIGYHDIANYLRDNHRPQLLQYYRTMGELFKVLDIELL